MTAPQQRKRRPKKDEPTQVVRVVRHGMNATYIWNRKPSRQDCKAALLADPPGRPRIGHCWPGFDEPPYFPMDTPTIIPIRTCRPASARRPTGAYEDERVRCKDRV